jgi:hypothetical protein
MIFTFDPKYLGGFLLKKGASISHPLEALAALLLDLGAGNLDPTAHFRRTNHFKTYRRMARFVSCLIRHDFA